MNLIPRWTWLQAIRRLAPAARADAAEMGTAYGLDASFAESRPAPVTPPGAAPRRSAFTGLPRQP